MLSDYRETDFAERVRQGRAEDFLVPAFRSVLARPIRLLVLTAATAILSLPLPLWASEAKADSASEPAATPTQPADGSAVGLSDGDAVVAETAAPNAASAAEPASAEAAAEAAAGLAAETAEAAAVVGAAAAPEAAANAERTTLNLLGEVDSSSGESRRNENVDITLIDNNVLKELNRRMGTTATVVRTFDVEKGYFGSEFGAAPSAPAHLKPTRGSGFHGSIYESHGNSIFSARSFFQVGGVKPARSNDYGFQVGLPLWRGANFSVEANQQRNRGNVNGNVLVPTPEERIPLVTDPDRRAFVSRILDAFPDEAPNRTDINPRALNTNAPQSINNDTIGTRLDQGLGDWDRLFLHHRFKAQKVDAFQLVKGQNPNTTTRSHEGRLTWNRTWSATTTSDVSAGYNRVTSLLSQDETALGPLIFTGRQLQTLGGTSSVPFDRAHNRFRYEGLVRHARGRHLLTLGAGAVRGQINGTESSGHIGMWRFSSDFKDEFGNIRDTITNLRLGTPTGFYLGIGNTHRGFRDWRMLYYAGDQWNVNAKLTLTFGLRYEPVTRPVEVAGLSSVPYDCDCNNYGPSFGFAYRLGEGWGVLRGAYGLHYGEVSHATYTNARFNPPGNITLRLTAPDILDPLAGVSVDPNARSTFYDLSPDLASPYSHQYNFSWELTPARDWTLRLGYLGSRAHRLLSAWSFNRARVIEGLPLTTENVNERRPDQRYFDVRRILNGSRGYYDAAKVHLIARRRHGLSLDASYWFSKAIDLGANYSSTADRRDGFMSRSQTELDVHGDVKALSVFDQPHAALWRFSYETPRLRGIHRLPRSVFGSWTMASVVLLKAGTPFSLTAGSDGPGTGNVDGTSGDRPHILDPSILGNSADHPDTSARQLPISAFAFIRPEDRAGTLGRNTFRKDGIRNINFSLVRSWRVGGEKTLRLRVESINFFNTAQFAEPGTDLTGDNFGQITNTLNDGRTFRFLLRFAF